MIERLRQALQHVDELPLLAQENIAEQIEEWTGNTLDWHVLIGSVQLPDDFDEIEAIQHVRHEVPPSLPIEEDV